MSKEISGVGDSLCVCVCVFVRSKTKTNETKITKLGTGIVDHDISLTNEYYRSKDQGHEVQKHIDKLFFTVKGRKKNIYNIYIIHIQYNIQHKQYQK